MPFCAHILQSFEDVSMCEERKRKGVESARRGPVENTEENKNNSGAVWREIEEKEEKKKRMKKQKKETTTTKNREAIEQSSVLEQLNFIK